MEYVYVHESFYSARTLTYLKMLTAETFQFPTRDYDCKCIWKVISDRLKPMKVHYG